MSVLRQLLKKIQPSRSKKGHQMNPNMFLVGGFNLWKILVKMGIFPKYGWKNIGTTTQVLLLWPESCLGVFFNGPKIPWKIQAERWGPIAVLGRMSGKQFETSGENDIFKETCLSSGSLLQNPQQCLKLHDIYSSPVAKKKTSIFWTLQVLHLTSSYNPFPRWFQSPCHASNFFFHPPILLSLPNDGTAFPAAFAKSRVPGKMAWDHGGSLDGGTPRVPTPHQVCCVFFWKVVWGRKNDGWEVMTNFVTIVSFVKSWSEVLTKDQSIGPLLWAHISGNDYMWFFQTLRYIAPSAEQNAKVRSIETWALHVFCCSKGKRILFESLERGKRLRLKVEKG